MDRKAPLISQSVWEVGRYGPFHTSLGGWKGRGVNFQWKPLLLYVGFPLGHGWLVLLNIHRSVALPAVVPRGAWERLKGLVAQWLVVLEATEMPHRTHCPVPCGGYAPRPPKLNPSHNQLRLQCISIQSHPSAFPEEIHVLKAEQESEREVWPFGRVEIWWTPRKPGVWLVEAHSLPPSDSFPDSGARGHRI